MKVYFDASAIVPIIVNEPRTKSLLRWIENAAVEPVVSSFGIGEASTAILRLRRQKIVDEATTAALLRDLDLWTAEGCSTVETLSADVRGAVNLVRRFELFVRMPDALHLCICKHHELPLVTFDAGMRKTASQLGQLLEGPSDF